MAFDPDPELAALLESFLHPQLKRISPGLERVETLLKALGNPHQKLPPVIHIAGTNGKGSTLAMLQAILEAAGKKVHKYTSPHLISFTERIILAGEPITKAQLVPILQCILDLQDDYPATFFEATTIAAFVAFSEHPADVVLLETGLGGRLDASNVLDKPLANIITPIGCDHQEYLGETLAEIAREKAGILRVGVPALIAEQEPEALEAISHYYHVMLSGGEAGVETSHVPLSGDPSTSALCASAQDDRGKLFIANQDWNYQRISDERWEFRQNGEFWKLPAPSLIGEHQIANAALAVACIRGVYPEVTQCQIAEGLQNVAWPGRLQRIDTGYWRKFVPEGTELYLDGAHNPMAGEKLAKWTERLPQQPVLVLAMKSDKDAQGFIRVWRDKVHQIVATVIPDETEYVSPGEIADICQELAIPSVVEERMEEALTQAARLQRPILICGSLYLAGAILAKN